VISGEGGSSSWQAAVNVAQTILNRAYNYWTCWDNTCTHWWINRGHIPWDQITEEQLLALLLYIVSEPYAGSDGVMYPAYNAWGAPYPHPQAGVTGDAFTGIRNMVANILANPGLAPNDAPVLLNMNGRIFSPLDPIRNNTSVIFFGSASADAWGENGPRGWVAFDAWTAGDISYKQYYGTMPINPP
jgi:hypothetical protein